MKHYRSVLLAVIFLLAHVSYVQAVMNVQLPFYDGKSYKCTQNSDASPTHNDAYTIYDLDFGLSNGSIVVAAANGTMRQETNRDSNGNIAGFGRYAKVDHGNGKWTMYGHLSGYIAHDGDSVVAGQPIAYSGNSGLSIGSGGGYHLHFGVHNGSGVGVSEKMNVYGLDQYTSILDYFATGAQNETEFVCGLTAGHNYESRPIGALFSDFQCKNLSGNNGVLCWKNNPTTCEDRENHVRYYRNNEGANQSESNANTWEWCAYDSGQSANALSYIEGGYGVGGVGPGYETSPDDTANPGLPDFITDKLELKNSSGVEKYTFTQMETVQFHSYSKNIGDADWAKFSGETEADDIYVKFYLSNGYKEDSHSEWDCVGTQQISKGNLDVGETKHEWDQLNLATHNNGNPIAPGVYNIVACVDRKYDNDNGDGEVPEIHKSNNCSTEAVFVVALGAELSVQSLTLSGTSEFFKEGDTPPIAQVSVTNGGGEPSENVLINWYIDEAYYANDTIEHQNIMQGAVANEDFTLPSNLPAGEHAIKSCIDFDDNNPADNCMTTSFHVYIPGDLNHDHTVNSNDFTLLASNYGLTQCGLIGDINGDCTVNMNDYTILQSNYGRSE